MAARPLSVLPPGFELDGADSGGLPEGFKLDAPQGAQLPDGFQLDGAPQADATAQSAQPQQGTPGVIDYLKELGTSTVRGGAGTVASMGRGLEVMTSDDAGQIAEVEKGIEGLSGMTPEQATDFMRSLPQKLSPAVAWNYQRAIRKLWAGDTEGAKPFLDAARGYTDTRPIEDQGLTVAGKKLEDAATTQFPQDPRFKGSITSDIGQALGSTAVFLPIGILSGGTGVAATGALAGADQSYQQAKQDIIAGKYAGSPDQANADALAAGRLGSLPGASEVVPIEGFLEQMPKFIPGLRAIAGTPVWGKFAKAFGRMGVQALSEGGQEAFQQWAANVINKLKINPDQDATEGVLYNALIGGAVGVGMQAPAEGWHAIFGEEEAAPPPGPQPTPRRAPPGSTPPGAAPPPGASSAPGVPPTETPPSGTPPRPTNPTVSGAPADAYLVGAGYTLEQIADMNPQERDQALREALQQGVQPADLTAGAPAPGTAPRAPRAASGAAQAAPQGAPQATPPRHPPGPGIWANQSSDQPVNILDEPPQQDPASGQWFQRVEDGNGGSGFVPFDELQPQGQQAAPDMGNPVSAPGTAPMAPRGTRSSKVNVQSEQDLEAVRPTVNPEPTPAQAKAGNYQKGHIRIHGMNVSIENPRGSVRRGTDEDGNDWTSPELPADTAPSRGTAKETPAISGVSDTGLRASTSEAENSAPPVDDLDAALNAAMEQEFGRQDETPTAPQTPAAPTFGSSLTNVPGAGYAIGDFAFDFNTRGEGRYLRVRSLSGKKVFQGRDGGNAEHDVTDIWNSTDPNQFEHRQGNKVGINSLENNAPTEFAPVLRDWLSGRIDEEQAIAAISAMPRGNGLNAAATASVQPAAPTLSQAQIDRSLSDYIGNTRKPLTQEGFAKHAGITTNEAGKALQRAHLAGQIVPSRNGGYRRPPTRVEPLDVLAYVASKGGVSDPHGELAGLDLPKMTTYGPVVRKTGLHPDKMREAVIEAGYMRDEGLDRDPNGQATSTVADFYDLMSRAAGGEKIYSVHDQAKGDELAATRKAERQNPDLEGMHPIEMRWGPEVWQKVQEAFKIGNTPEETWSYQEISDAARMIAESMDAGDAFERAAFMQIESDLHDSERTLPEITQWLAERDEQAMKAFGDLPPFPDVEPQNVASQEPQGPSAGVSRLGEEDQGPGSESPPRGEEGTVPGTGEDVSTSGGPEETGPPAEQGQDLTVHQPTDTGPFGPVFHGYNGDWRGASLRLEQAQTGEAPGALHHADIGPIALVWGETGTGHSDGYGLSKIIAWHPEIMDDLQGAIDRMQITSRSKNRIQLASKEDRAAVRLEWDGQQKTWLIGAFKKTAPRRTEKFTGSLSDLWAELSHSARRGQEDIAQAPKAGNSAPNIELGADNKPQLVVPGAEQTTEDQAKKTAAAEKARKELEIRQKQSKLRKSGQESIDEQDGGLFNTAPKQSSIFDEPAPNAATSIDDALDAAMEQEFGAKPAKANLQGNWWEPLMGGEEKPAKKPKTAPEAAKSAAKNTAMGLDQVAKGLQALFGDKNKLSSGFTFDEDTYRQALPFFKAGAAHLKEAAKNMGELALALVRALRSNGMTADAVEAMRPYLKRFMADIRDGKESLDAPGSSEILEPDRGDATASDGVGAADVPASAGADGQGSGFGRAKAGGDGGRSNRGGGIPQADAPVVGENGNLELPARLPGAEGSDASVGERIGGPESGGSRLPDDREPAKTVARTVAKEANLATRIEQQKAAERIKGKARDIQNIRDTLPVLMKDQQDDVLKVEQRYDAPTGHGMLLTNGTGTGKTLSGLGVVKRFAREGKSNILIVAPSQDILKQWQNSAKWLGLDISVLESTQDKGRGVVATTYANLGENPTLADRQWDLVVTDESHKLSSDKDGTATTALEALRAITFHPDGMMRRGQMVFRKEYDRVVALKPGKNPSNAAVKAYEDALDNFDKKVKAAQPAWEKEPRSKVLMLSATPFAYHFSLDYAAGYLYELPKADKGGYNQPGARDQFYITNFGYRMRTGKLTKPEADVNIDVMERQFHENMKKSGALSGRALEVEKDYDRKFILVDSAIGQQIDQALEFLAQAEDGKFRGLHDIVYEKFDYLTRMRLLEAIKAEASIPYIRKSLKMGRKIVVFHDYNEGGGASPFDLKFAPDLEIPSGSGGKQKMVNARQLYNEFLDKNPYVKKLDFADYGSPIDAITREFPEALVYNGTIPNKKREEAKRLFNADGSGKDIIIVQSAAGEAGISLHDTTGKHQRVLLNLGMPVRPTTALQEEGRIYRVGQMSDAIFRYMNTGTGWERWTFASKIAERSGTAENLAMGDQARAIKMAFIDAFNNADDFQPEAGEGTGGKVADRPSTTSMSEFERAKTHYFANQKIKGRRDQREGIDYFPTPEPLGLKMVEWANVNPGEKMLEPSAGHGAIARYFPEATARTLVEPSSELASRASLNSPGARVVMSRFEDIDLVNKYDAIVMNPPFGTAGKTAIDHLEKAARHLKNGGRIVALIPRGGMTDKRLEAFYGSDVAKALHIVADIHLPSVTFERAGTSVSAHVIILEKQTNTEDSKKVTTRAPIDLSSASSISEFFDRVENVALDPRVEPSEKEADIPATGEVTLDGITFDLTNYGSAFDAKLKTYAPSRFRSLANAAEANGGFYLSSIKSFSFKSAAERQAFLEKVSKGLSNAAPIQTVESTAPSAGTPRQFKTTEVIHAKTRQKLFVATLQDRVSPEEYQRVNAVAKKHGGYYSSFKGSGAVPGFQFPSEDARIQFMSEMQGPLKGTLSSKARPVATLTGKELMDFKGGGDMPELRRRAQAHYKDNFVGRSVKMADGTLVKFNGTGLGESTEGRKGDILLRAVPAIPAIIEKGQVVLREPGNKPHVSERIIVTAPVEFMGKIIHLAVSIHKMDNGLFQYSFNMDRDAGGPGVSVPGGLASLRDAEVGLETATSVLNLFELPENFNSSDSAASPLPLGRPVSGENRFQYAMGHGQRRELVSQINQIAARILGHHLVGIDIYDTMPNGENQRFDPNTELIKLALRSRVDGRVTLRHEGVHLLRHVGAFSAREWAILAREADRRWIEQYDIRGRYWNEYKGRFDLTDSRLEELMQEEGVADAFSEYWLREPSEDVIGRIFYRVKQFLEAVANFARGYGFNTVDSIFNKIESGDMGRRPRGYGSDRGFELFKKDERGSDQPPLESRARQRPPRNPAAGSFEEPHDERVLRALSDSTDSILNRIRRAASAFGVATRRHLQDREVDLLRTQGAIEDASGPIPETRNAYLAASLYPGRAAQRDEDLVKDVIEPLVQDIARRGLTLEDVNDFVMARHAFERNLETGKINKPGTQFAEAMTNPDIVGGSGLSDNQASDILNRAVARGKYNDLEAVGDKIVALNRRTLDAQLAEGLITQDQYDAVTTKYQYYVPLRGEENILDENHPDSPKTGRRFDIRGREFQQAFGRKTKADSPLAYSIMQARQTIVRIEKNRVGKRFLRLVQANPNEGFWQVNRIDLKKVIDPNTGYVRNVFDRGAQEAENVFAVKVGGKRYNITLHHEGLLRAMKGIGGENMGDLVAIFHKINRYFAAINTSLSAEFIFRNFLRDLQHAGIVLQEEKIRGLTGRVMTSIPQAAYGMNQMLQGDLSSGWAQYAREYADAGGKIGFMDRNDVESEKKNLERLMSEATAGPLKQTWMFGIEQSFGRIARWNDTVENTLRLATYVQLRRSGVSVEKSAFVARELTVNFNRKGQSSPFINAGWLFFNAATQGSASLFMRLKRSKVMRAVAFGIIIEGMLSEVLNRMIAGDDDDKKNRYDKIPFYEKSKNHIFMMPKWFEEKYGVPYYKLPMSLGWNFFHNVGTEIADAAQGVASPLEAFGNIASAFADAFNPLGSGGFLNIFAPTILDPAADIATNKDFTGRDIVPKVYDETTPYAQRFRSNVSPWAKWITDELTKMTGGSEERPGKIDLSPEWIDYMSDFLTGGIGKLASRGFNTITNWNDPEQFDIGKVPFARIFTGRDSKFEDRDQYFQIRDAVHITDKELKARLEEHDKAAADEVRTKHAREVAMIPLMRNAEKQLAKLRKDYKATKNNPKMGETTRQERLQMLSQKMDEIQLKVRTRWNQLGEGDR